MSDPIADEEPPARPRPMFSITEAADAAGIHRNTIRRYLERDRFPGALRVRESGQEVWRIPLEDLLAAGFTLHAPTPPPPAERPQPADPDQVADLEAQLAETRSDLERARADLVRANADLLAARTIAEERSRTIELLSAVTRALNVAGAAPAPRKRWWWFGYTEPARPASQPPDTV